MTNTDRNKARTIMRRKFETHSRKQRLGRPKMNPQDVRREEIRLYLNVAEKQRLQEDAKAAGLRPADYLRQLILGYRPSSLEGNSFGNPKLLYELNAIGNNLNQAVRDLHADSTRYHDWEEIRELLKAALERVVNDDVC